MLALVGISSLCVGLHRNAEICRHTIGREPLHRTSKMWMCPQQLEPNESEKGVPIDTLLGTHSDAGTWLP